MEVDCSGAGGAEVWAVAGAEDGYAAEGAVDVPLGYGMWLYGC
jgi:hypothetical protein